MAIKYKEITLILEKETIERFNNSLKHDLKLNHRISERPIRYLSDALLNEVIEYWLQAPDNHQKETIEKVLNQNDLPIPE